MGLGGVEPSGETPVPREPLGVARGEVAAQAAEVSRLTDTATQVSPASLGKT